LLVVEILSDKGFNSEEIFEKSYQL
jgi:hypothetical protein